MLGKIRKNLQGKTIAVFGASSNIGRRFTQEAAKRGAVIIAFARDTNKVPSYPKRRTTGSIEAVQGDITSRKDVRRALHDRKVDVTINFAAVFSADVSKARAVNVIGEQYILDASVEYGVKRHIYISTIATLTPRPNAYGDTKLKAEEIVKVAGKKKLDWIILRYAHVLGSRTWDQPFKIILPFLRIGIPKVPTDAKDAVFPYTTIDTVIEATLAAIEARPNQTIIIFDERITIGEYLSTMEKIYDVKWSFLPNQLLQLLDKLFGKYFPKVTGYSAALDFLAHPPTFENETMKKELKIRTRDFQDWIKAHFLQRRKHI